MSNDEINQVMEAATLLPDRYYIILRSTGDGEFTLSAYDTTGKKYESDDDLNTAMIIQEGALDMIRYNTDELYDHGVSTVKFRMTGQEMVDEEDDEDPKVIEAIKDNVIRVDFGSEQ
tara:strand:- start:1476 stop:1826 length:351 start_codon:yes stop_codon:yes gene_type:complete